MKKTYQEFISDWKIYCLYQENRFTDFVQLCHDQKLYSPQELEIYVLEICKDVRFPYYPLKLLQEFRDEN